MSRQVVIPAAAVNAWVRLADALDDNTVPCTGGWYWTSDMPDEREAAVHQCRGCPVLAECAAYAAAAGEAFGVWAGVDRTAKPGRKSA